METRAVVMETDGDFALVETDRKSACDGCHKQAEGAGCAMCSLLGNKKSLRTRVKNTLGAKPGDTVLLETPSNRVLAYGAMVFLMPLALGLLFYFVGGLLFEALVWQYVCSLCGFAGAFVFLWFYSKRVIARRCDVVITKILTPSSSSASSDTQA